VAPIFAAELIDHAGASALWAVCASLAAVLAMAQRRVRKEVADRSP
jgi:hypothetical protein